MKKKTIFRVLASALCSALFLSSFAGCNILSQQHQSSSVEEGNGGRELTVVAGEYLYRGGVSGYTVVTRDDANMYEELAASELALNLSKSTGSSIAVAKE